MLFLSLADILLVMVSISTFTGFLISGLVIIAIFSIVADVFHFIQAAPETRQPLTKAFPFEFTISKLRESRDVELPNAILINGLLFGSNALTYNLPIANDTETASLSFDVNRTNRYAPLTVRADGLVESRKLPTGHYSFNLGKREGSTLILIQPESSWWRIWAPALYEINNVKLKVNAFKSQNESFTFSLDKELPAESASLVMQFDKNTGSFETELNGALLHRGSVRSVETIPINTSLLTKENRLGFAAANNSQFAGRGTIVINYNG